MTRRDTDWYCLKCKRSLANMGKGRLDTVTAHETADKVGFIHDDCQGTVKPGRKVKH